MIPERLVIATANPGKLRELRELVAEWGPVTVAGLDAFPGVAPPEERGASYAENAAAKATAVARATGVPALGDDSGLEVEALGGLPGLHSARYAGTEAERIAKLLEALRDVPEPRRGARFVCVVTAVFPDGHVATAEGVCRGRIATVPAGRSGFGYDPVFVPEGLERTFAEVGAEVKQRLSHRARAVRALGERLRRGPR
ncbi:MAG: RdgB/HAM1 family non-canonical purine NTP pyrophosphatase [Deltaproteobacteria bacterium]|nr:MAG: RdgB/HAM1 family non-canonical purine NTP pyrophosphatase [Deltaproteobacteria bacterium]TMB04654.1 MAG: RdgB/HAM1 family non-canonical purine NTP pyrophosphatase [Deltaproteobacteria bacterium]